MTTIIGRDGADWWRGATIYQIYPRSFADANGDGIGDLRGITDKLDHVASLGVDAIWLSPFFTSPMKDFGYDVSDYRGVDQMFGTLEDFDALLARAHALGLKVVIDQVYAHTSDAHAWFEESRADRTNDKADWYVWADARPDGTPPTNWQSRFGGPGWTYDSRRRQYYMHNFLKEQPQLNVRLPEVQDALLDVARFWLDRGVDGFRLDVINYAMHHPELRDNPVRADTSVLPARTYDYQVPLYNRSHPDILGFVERLRGVLDAYPDRFSVAEIGGADPDGEMHSFTEGKARLHTAYSFCFLTAAELNVQVLSDNLKAWPGTTGEGWPSWAFSNHDAPRHVSRWATEGERDRVARMAMLVLVALRGNVFVYQGEELGLPQATVPYERLQDPEAIANWPTTAGRDGARTPMPWTSDKAFGGFSTVEPWLPLDAAHVGLAVDVQERDPASMLWFTRNALALRRTHAALRTGDLTIRDDSESVLLLERTNGTERLLLAANLERTPAVVEVEGRWSVCLASTEMPDRIEGQVRLPPFAAVIARRDG